MTYSKHVTDAYAQRLAAGLTAQGVEFDNLGDNESICLEDRLPTINLAQLAEFMLAGGDRVTLALDAAKPDTVGHRGQGCQVLGVPPFATRWGV